MNERGEYDPYWCVIGKGSTHTDDNTNTDTTTNQGGYNQGYWNVNLRPASNHGVAARPAQQQEHQQAMHVRSFGGHVAGTANAQQQQQQHLHHGGAQQFGQQRMQYGSAHQQHNNTMGAMPRAAAAAHRQQQNAPNDMDISHSGYNRHNAAAAEPLRNSSLRLSSYSAHTFDKTIGSGDITMSSDEFERLRLMEFGDDAQFGDDYHAFPDTYDDQKPRALEQVKSHNISSAVRPAMGQRTADAKPQSIHPNKDMQVSPLCSPESVLAKDNSITMTTNIKDLMKSISRPPLEGGDVMEVGELEDFPTPGIIQPWMAVIGDKSARMPPRLTAGSMTLREVKTWYQDNRENYQNTADLYHDAMEYYFGLMKQRFGRHFPSDRAAQEATILVYCGSPEKPLRMERVAMPHCYKHRADMRKANANKYGVAKLPIATQQFLTSKDGPPPLDQQLLDYCTRVEKRDDLPERERKTFILYLSFTKALLDQANAGCPIAKSGLKKTNLNTSLRDLWKELSGI